VRAAQLQVWESDYSADYEVTEASATHHAEFLPRRTPKPPSPLDKFRDHKESDDGIPPNRFVINTAQRVLERCAYAELPWDRIVAIPDGGLAIYFFGTGLTTTGAHKLVARLALDNDGATTLLLEDVGGQQNNITDEDIADDDLVDEILDLIKSHISG
jgi:hypothetical protein